VTHIKWSDAPREAMNDKMTRQVVHTPQFTIARLEMKAGAVVPSHSHTNEQVTTVLEGLLRFNIGGESVDLVPGQSLTLASLEPHGVEVLEDSVVLDVFSPPRQDWIDGDDAYLRR
jgi:quercetin dioxygenase-like cupin family protein